MSRVIGRANIPTCGGTLTSGVDHDVPFFGFYVEEGGECVVKFTNGETWDMGKLVKGERHVGMDLIGYTGTAVIKAMK
jgi:hypothetical protein